MERWRRGWWLLSVLALQRPLAAAQESKALVEPALLERIAVAAPSDFFRVNIVLAEQVPAEELEALGAVASKTERRELVISSLEGAAASTQGALLSFLEVQRAAGRARGRIDPLWIHNVISAEVAGAVIRELAARPDVAAVEYDPPIGREVLAACRPGAGSSDPTCGLESVRAPEVWERFRITGRGVIVGVIDTGVCRHHPDIRDQLWKNPDEEPGNGIDDDRNGFVDDVNGWNFADGNGDIDDTDEYSHGSHVAGIIVGNGTSGVRCGVAPDARVMVLKFWDSHSPAYPSDVWRCIQYGLENGADILNGSFGWPHRNRQRAVWRAICDNAIAAGVVLCFAAGNEGCEEPPANVLTPADVPGVIAVGAVYCSDQPTWFSSCGPTTWMDEPPYDDFPYPPGLIKPDVCAPGVDLSHDRCDGYTLSHGTSFATPHVSGCAALLLEADPTLDAWDIRALLEETARDLGVPGKDNQFGAGRIDAFAAVRCVLGITRNVER